MWPSLWLDSMHDGMLCLMQAVEAKEQTKGFFSGVFGGNSGDEEAQKKGKNLKDKASDTLSDAEDK